MFSQESRKSLFNSVLKNKGGSFNFDGKEIQHTDGYAVSLQGFETVTKVEGLSASAFVNIVNDTLRKVDGLADPATHMVGVWVTGDSLYVDLSVHVKDKQQAIEKAIAGSQLAIWDFENGVEIVTPDQLSKLRDMIERRDSICQVLSWPLVHFYSYMKTTKDT